MIGAIAGDIIGSVYEGSILKSEDFPLFSAASQFTDDTVLTIATAEHLLHGEGYAPTYKKWSRRYPDAGYGAGFITWFQLDREHPYNSWGNGAAMRVSPVAYAFDNLHKVHQEAERSAGVTHNHPEGIKGAQAVAAAVFLARMDNSKSTIRDYVQSTFDYDLSRSLSDIREDYQFEVSAQKSVPEAIIAFLASESYEDAVRKAISLGGDSDTQACIAGAIAHAYYKHIPEEIIAEVKNRLPNDMLDVMQQFSEKFKNLYQ